MFSRIIPSWEQIEQFKQPLTEGEIHLAKFLDAYLKLDTTFQGDDLTNYNGWLIFVQPFLNGSRPDIIIFNPQVGVQIFEVKDWNIFHYSFGSPKEGGRSYPAFCVRDNRGMHTIKSPTKQVLNYKEKIVSLLPQIGEMIDNESRSYGLIKTAVYFHKSTTDQAQSLFQSQVKDFTKFPIIGYDTLVNINLSKIVPDGMRSQSLYWKSEWNKELLFWLKPPVHVLDQGMSLILTNDQQKLAKPQPGHHQRVRGVAGSGKTQALAYRASQLASQGFRVLVLTYNITLWHLIHDMVQKSPYSFAWDKITITYFHGFCKDVLNEYDKEWPGSNSKQPENDENNESLFRREIPNAVLEAIKENGYTKYDAILIDEGQDFCIEWYHMLCHFLTDRDELVVVCDKKQNIYGTEMAWLDKRRRGVEKFGDWIELRKIIRLPEQIARISVEFSEAFNLNQDIQIVNIEKPDLWNQQKDHVIWWNIEYNWLDKVNQAFEIIKNQAMHNHPSDIVILLPNQYLGLECVNHFEQRRNIMVNHVFENRESRRIHRHKKAFWMGDSRLKMSTIHSFKGWEAPNVIVVIPSSIPGDEQLYDRVIYTAMTRSRENLIIINVHPRYMRFGESIPSEWIE